MTRDCSARSADTGFRFLEGFRVRWEPELPPELIPVLQDHYRNLLALVNALNEAGHTPDEIRRCVHDLIASYEAKLLKAIETHKKA